MIDKRIAKLILIDVITAFLSIVVAFWLRFDFTIPVKHSGLEVRNILWIWMPNFIFIQILVFATSGLYNRIWRFTSLADLFAIIKSVLISCTISFMGVLFLMGTMGYPRSVLILYFLLNTISVCLTRLSVRIYHSHYIDKSLRDSQTSKKRLILIGAGVTGEKIARELINSSQSTYKVVGFVDDDKKKIGKILHGIKILGSTKDLINLDIIYDELLICVPSAKGDQIREIVYNCKKTGRAYKTVPSLSELIDKDVSIKTIRDVSYADLLGRKEVKLDLNSLENLLIHKRVLISGAGGSIGSELVKQTLKFNPSEMVCIDITEEKIFELQTFADSYNSDTIIKPLLVNINSTNQLEKIFNEYRPQIVFHAAAYKHVPIQELHPWTAVETNIGGTLNMIELANKFMVNKFVLVSTDKAVNPVNIMGATKRAAEKLIQSYSQNSKTQFLAVRFGNVLGSSGSAIPTFQDQINKGGPVTITHPEMTRYFMSIQEASQLILQCGAIGKDGEIFLLEMGKPIKIDQIARDLIKLSGFEPETDIPIIYTGLRPGEKLYEELQHIGEKKIFTEYNKIMILKDGKSIVPWKTLKSSIKELLIISKSLDGDKIQEILKRIIPTYQPTVFKHLIDEKQKYKTPYSFEGEA